MNELLKKQIKMIDLTLESINLIVEINQLKKEEEELIEKIKGIINS